MFYSAEESLEPAERAAGVVRALWEPPPDMTVSQWAEAYRVMSKGTTARPGTWKSEVYQREMMDVFNDPAVHEIVVVKCTQVGWSEILNNIIGRHIHLDPKPMMLVQPSLDDAKGYGKKRIAPMIESCPVLKERVKPSASRRTGNTILLKEFPGGFLKLTGANSGKGLRSDAVPIVMYDEADAMPDDIDGEGHPFDLGDNRTEAYADFKSLKGSTPAKPKGLGRMEALWDKSDQRRFHVHCPLCGHLQVLWWRDPDTGQHRLVWELDEHGDVRAETVRYVCAGCAQGIPEHYKQQMLDGGRWVATQPGRAIVGFHLNALYRPWKDNWSAMAQKWVDAQGDHEKLKEFITLQLGEFWEESGDRLDADDVSKRRECYPMVPSAPDDALRPWDYEIIAGKAGVLTCVGDVQENRIEAQVKAWGPGGESWLVAHEVFWGDPSNDQGVWEAFDAFRITERLHESGARIRPLVTLVDSGDQTDAVYDYVLPRQNLRDGVFACKGVDYHTKPVLVQEGTAKRNAVRLFTIATHAAKERVFSRLKLAEHGPGYMHFPMWTTEEYFTQLTSEKKVMVRNKRTRMKKAVWVKTHTRNEALDLEVMSLGAVFVLQHILDPRTYSDLGRIASALRGEIRLSTVRSGRRVRSHGVE